MQNFVKATMALVLAFVMVLVCAPNNAANAQNAGVISAILNKMESNYRDLRSLRAGISMEQYDAITRKADKKGGNVQYLPAKGRNASFRVDWTYPAKEILSVVDGQYKLCRERLMTCYEGTSKRGPGNPGSPLSFLNMSGSQLKASFDIKDIFDETLWGGVKSTHFTLYPKTKTDFKYAEVWVDAYGMPVQSKVVEHSGNATTIRLLNIERNANINKDNIKFNANGYKMVKA